ncbi:hypothetical protein DY926_02990 [Komagataeibacter melaceti]|uniref:STAS domain-containing protein n=1 Tax=Komagataeibacter melaceti TaxID=2766577 RepID=A0A371Z3F6_9PROT|nr:STAS domain-containing protein [Komagataeibacter melaceti]RFD21030.1 hypothetical protein DY926_02990 [Komagataeibacter melaceti]
MSDPQQGADPSVADAPASTALPERLDTSAAFALKELIEQARENAGTDTPSLDASGVTYVGGLCLQLLVASGCTLVAPSDQVKEAYAIFGVSKLLSEPVMSPEEQ